MPRTARKSAPSAAVETRPFADDTTAAYAAQSDADRAKIAKGIAADKAAGLSGNELRAKYGERLTGPARRKVLREHGFDSAAHIARSYAAYRDGAPRDGSRHAREHGALAEERRAAAASALAERVASTPLPEVRAALREAGQPVPRKATELREAFAALLA